MSKVRVGIVGAAGYTGGELVRILIHHPKVELVYASSRSQVGKKIAEVFQDLIGQTELEFSDSYDIDVDVLFICLPHGKSKEFLTKTKLKETIKIIDLSNEFRLKPSAENFIYGLPELNKSAIKNANNIANPGCFATAIQLALLPLAGEKKLKDDIHISAITGSTGAGVKPLATTHFSWRNNNMSVYKAFRHQHLDEIKQSLHQLQEDFEKAVNFIPYRGDFTRGIIATVYTKFDGTTEEANTIYKNFYKDAAFTFITTQNPNLKQVVNTNKCLLYLEVIDGQLIIISLIDNLIKGASGQAVQNLNLMMDWNENMGLQLKASVF